MVSECIENQTYSGSHWLGTCILLPCNNELGWSVRMPAAREYSNSQEDRSVEIQDGMNDNSRLSTVLSVWGLRKQKVPKITTFFKDFQRIQGLPKVKDFTL